ncbi:hypothetical protein Ahy_B06g080696 isoform A [Arachis hypogaea]|uniref:ABC transmembrane type-1 domain-containing protein n=1 Tax=Arachis hypogaea TaxID=3818 RepID=A0A444YIS1_ARAHY|nr:hypothetical protein Ahy_B06g080696 isoform A [Arachis hypogaea]
MLGLNQGKTLAATTVAGRSRVCAVRRSQGLVSSSLRASQSGEFSKSSISICSSQGFVTKESLFVLLALSKLNPYVRCLLPRSVPILHRIRPARRRLVAVALSKFFHYFRIFICGFAVGFGAVWQLALVTLVVVPLIAVIGAIHTTTLAKLSAKSQAALSLLETIFV